MIDFTVYIFLCITNCFFVNALVSLIVYLSSDNNQLVLLNFYADWCRFSQMLSPVWDDLAEKVSAKFPEPGKVAIGKVDCEKQQPIATRYESSYFMFVITLYLE